MSIVNVTKGSLRSPANPRGLGDLVHTVALPIAKALGLDCLDPATGDLRTASPCAGRQANLNEAAPIAPPVNRGSTV